jgi:hypothetical protein
MLSTCQGRTSVSPFEAIDVTLTAAETITDSHFASTFETIVIHPITTETIESSLT